VTTPDDQENEDEGNKKEDKERDICGRRSRWRYISLILVTGCGSVKYVCYEGA
jgi:hypothetical protein